MLSAVKESTEALNNFTNKHSILYQLNIESAQKSKYMQTNHGQQKQSNHLNHT